MTRFPRLQAYLQQLPDGLASFPAAKAKASIHRTVYAFSAQPIEGLPEELQNHLDDPDPAVKWMPACHTLALVVAIVEARGLLPGAEAAFIREAAQSLFATPMYRILMRAATPRLIMKGANFRWQAFFRGSRLLSKLRKGVPECDLWLEAPENLFHPDLASIFTDVLTSAVCFTDDPTERTTIELVEYDPGRIHYLGRW